MKTKKTFVFSQSLLVNETQPAIVILLFFSSPPSMVYLIPHPRQSLPRQLSKSAAEDFHVVGKHPALNKGLCQAKRRVIYSFILESLSLCFFESSDCQAFSEKVNGSPGQITHLGANPQPFLNSSASQGKTFYLPACFLM